MTETLQTARTLPSSHLFPFPDAISPSNASSTGRHEDNDTASGAHHQYYYHHRHIKSRTAPSVRVNSSHLPTIVLETRMDKQHKANEGPEQRVRRSAEVQA